MIPQEQLTKLKPLQDIQNRLRTMKGQVKNYAHKKNSTRQQRNFSMNARPREGTSFNKSTVFESGYTGPKHYREIRKGKK